MFFGEGKEGVGHDFYPFVQKISFILPLFFIVEEGDFFTSSERHGIITQRTGSARYTRDYYGVLTAATLGRLYDRSREVSVFGSHPPGDVNFRQDLMEAVVGDWDVEVQGWERHFRVTYANTFDEPVGGLMNVLLTEDGHH